MSEPTFNGKHNKSKTKVLLVLYNAALPEWGHRWYRAGELSRCTGLTPAAVYCLMMRLTRWNYVHKRRPTFGDTETLTINGRTFTYKRPLTHIAEYHISIKGKRFIDSRVPDAVLDEVMPDLKMTVK